MSDEPLQTRKALARPSAARDEGGIDFAALLHGVRKHWPIVVALTILASGIAFLYTKSQTRIYQSSSLLDFDPHPVRPLGEKTDPMMGWVSYFDSQQNYETQFQIITSTSVLSKVVKDLGLQNDPRFAAPGTKDPVDAATSSLRGRVIVEPVKNSRLFYIRVEDPDAKLAQRLCKAVSEKYRDQNLSKSIDSSSDAAVWLSGQVDHYGADLTVDEEKLQKFKDDNKLPSSTLEEVSKMIRLEMQSYDDGLTATRKKRAEIEARNNALSKITMDNVDSVPASELLNSAYLQALRGQYLAATKERQDLMSGISGTPEGENHPRVIAATEKVSQSKRAMIDEVHNIQAAVVHDLTEIRDQEARESALYEDARRRAVDLNMKELEYHRLDRRRDQNEKMYDTLLERMKEADLAKMMRANNVDIVDEATDPKAPVRPNTLANLGAGTLIGLVLGLALAILREQLDTSLKAPSDVEEKLGVPFLGMLPSLEADGPRKSSKKGRRKRRGDLPRAPSDDPAIYVHQRPLSGVAEAARTLRTNLTFMSPDKPHRVILVTSSAPAEGKTTVACSIAIAMAQSGQKVCIIDCDLRRPRLHRVFNRIGDTGLTSVLVGEADLAEVAKPAMTGGKEIPNLWCIPAGAPPPNPADLLHSERFKKFLAEVGEHFDRVIIDSPPLAAVTDSAIVSTLVDTTIFVIRAFSTSFHLARQGLRALRDVDAQVAGAVLNAVDLNKTSYSYYYQQYYYYRREGYAPAIETDDDDDEHGTEGAAPPPPN